MFLLLDYSAHNPLHRAGGASGKPPKSEKG